MKRWAALILAVCATGWSMGCAGGRVRGAQGTEMQQQEEYLPEQKVKPPEGNINRVSGPLTPITPPPALEVDLERRPPRPPPEIEPDSEAGSQAPEPETLR